MHTVMSVHISPSYVPVEADRVGLGIIWGLNNIESVAKHIRVLRSPR
jgi:hypothetical protein